MSLFLLLLPFILFSGCGGMEENVPPRYSDFREVPGVERRDIEAIERIIVRREYLNYGALLNSETFYTEEGELGGFSRNFCAWLSDFFGIPFVLSIYEWDSLIEAMAAGEADFSGEFTPTEERTKRYFMSDALIRRPVFAFTLEDAQDPEEIRRERPLRCGFLDKGVTASQVIPVLDAPFEVVGVLNHSQVYSLLREGIIDVFFDESVTEAVLGDHDDIISGVFSPLIFSPVSFSTGSREMVPFVRVINACLAAGPPAFFMDMYKEGITEYQRHVFVKSLEPEEKRFIRRRVTEEKTIPVILENENYPVSVYNNQSRSWEGVAVEILQQIEKKTGLHFERINSRKEDEDTQFSLLETGTAALRTSLDGQEQIDMTNAERRKAFISTDPYLTDHYALISKNSFTYLLPADIFHVRVGLITDSDAASVFRKWFSSHNKIKSYDSYRRAFDALDRGAIDILMGTGNKLLLVNNFLERSGYKSNIILDSTYAVSFGLNRNEVMLRSIINKALNDIDLDSINDHWKSRVFDYQGRKARRQVSVFGWMLFLLALFSVIILVLFIRSHSMKKKFEIQVKDRAAQLEAATRVRREFLSRINHEIRTPLNAIVGMTQIAKKISASCPKTLRYLDEIVIASTHMLTLLNDILDMSKADDSKPTLHWELFSLPGTVREVENMMAHRCREKMIHFTCSTENIPETTVLGDKLRLKQVFINLLENAVKFTPRGGKIGLYLECRSENETVLTVGFQIRDNGIGINSTQLARLTEMLSKSETGLADRLGSGGMGLAISQYLVNAMGGSITIESEVNSGTTLNFVLSFEKTAVSEAKEPSLETPDLSEKRILLVEDLEINREILRESLIETGVKIDEAEDGVIAVKKIADSPPYYYNLVFMDIQMPNMDGYEATRRIRKLEREDAKHIPIIAMTVNTLKEDIEKAIMSGMNGHIAKPVDIELVIRTLKRELVDRER
ncbi:MAG: transporter substrate-binding domain-containing protein [Treponema sp.]|jgi:signal transduction histidine kinase/ActR/RegA family two-component response regulator|nr:transporter substrate-binding domain-containing protein [Treponema sp.]